MYEYRDETTIKTLIFRKATDMISSINFYALLYHYIILLYIYDL